MKSYLSLIPLSAKVHKRQNRMTLLCIIFAVFLVTAVFSMAEMGIRMEQARLLNKHGGQALYGIRDSETVQMFFSAAAFLFVLILVAGVLMIAGSINSNVAQRTSFFGMMRCIGMSKAQIIRFVRLEALNWCKTAIPIGVALGMAATWGLCAVLRLVVGEEFSDIPLFGISFIGIISGMVVGIVTVLIAASSPAKRASKVSPVTAVSLNAENQKALRPVTTARFLNIEIALGIHHAVSTKKNLILMTGSFALSIILFLSFSVLIDFVGCLMPQSASTSDIDISSGDGSNSIDRKLAEVISGMEGVKRVYGRRSYFEVPAVLNNDTAASGTIDLISFDDFDLACLAKDKLLKKGSNLSKVYGNSNYVLAAWDPNSSWKIGDKIQTGGEELEIAGLLNYDIFSSDGLTNGKITLITSSQTFTRLTKVTNYSLLMLQMTKDATNENIEAIRNAAGSQYSFADKRDQHTSGTYMAFVSCVYGFLAIITLVTLLNIINSISMSVSARIKQYGAMRAVGMDQHQLIKMIATEAFTYALSGCIMGCAVGLPFSRLLYDILITNHFPYAVWSLPLTSLLIILLFVLVAVAAAIYAPSKRLRNMAITATISGL